MSNVAQPSQPRVSRFFQEENGKPSSMRLMSFVALLAAIAFGALTLLVVDGDTAGEGVFISFGFLIAAFAPKALQKFAESRG